MRKSPDNHCAKREYWIWHGIKQRCTNPKRSQYCYYGGRGISIHKAWSTFDAFYRDMGPAPHGYSIDRIDNERGYEPGNCRWVPHKEQCRNKRTNHVLTFNGTTKALSAWAEYLGLNSSTIRMRLSRGWTIERTLSEPLIKSTLP